MPTIPSSEFIQWLYKEYKQFSDEAALYIVLLS